MKLNPDKWIKAEQQRRDIMARYAQDNHAAAAFEAMRRLAEKAPMLPGVQADLMKLAWAVCEFSTALTAADRLLALAPAQPAAVQAAADLFLLCGQPDKARAAWLRLEKSPQSHAAWLGLASLAERAGRMDEAAEWSAKALADNPRDAQSRIRAGCIARRQGRTSDAAAHLEPCSAPGVPPAIRASALYELGELHDKANDPASAAAAWGEAKRCMEQAWPSQVTLARRVRAKAIGMGQINTTAIVKAYGRGRYAARYADAMVLNGYDDWFLPSKDELNVMYSILSTAYPRIGSYARSFYWSSSEYDYNNAWTVNFKDGQQFDREKWLLPDAENGVKALRVRPVRAFG